MLATVAVAALSLITAACSSDSQTAATASSQSSKAPTTTVALSGDPVTIGFVDVEGDLGIDFGPQRKVAEQLVGDLNAKGGIGSHPIKFVSCVTKAASGGADCANQMVQDKAVIVLSFSTIDSATMYPILKSAGIPVLGGGVSPLNIADFTPDDNHFFVTAGALVRYATINPFIVNTLKAKSVGLVVGSSSAAQQAADLFIVKPLEALGVEVKSAQVAASNPDFTAAMNAVADTDVLQFLVSCADQDEGVKQAIALGYAGKIFGCGDPADLKAMGSAAAGVYGVGALKPVSDPRFANDADVKAFLALADQLGWETSGANEAVYSLVLAAKDAIIAAGGPTATGPMVAATLKATSKAPLALSSDNGLSCATPQFKLAATACNVDNMFVQVQPDGKTVLALDGTFVQPPSS